MSLIRCYLRSRLLLLRSRECRDVNGPEAALVGEDDPATFGFFADGEGQRRVELDVLPVAHQRESNQTVWGNKGK